MGNVGSRPEDGAALTLRDQARRKHFEPSNGKTC